jgi:pimeloyl-ACP methyl ester carboxylesterase
MNSIHFWFRSGNYSLLAHLDIPRQEPRNLGVVIVPPFGWEDVCSYRPLRFMAQSFASIGIPTLRYDLPGTGDSSGDAQDPGLFEAWIQSVADAAAELRGAAGVEEIAAVGIHLGAMIALASASRGSHLQHLVLWGAASSGRAIVRELRAAANMERFECLPPEDAPPQPFPGLESGGFLISPETLGFLEKMNGGSLQPYSRRILLLSRDELPHDAKLAAALRSCAETEVATGAGYSAMLGQPQEAEVPREASGVIAGFLTRGMRDGAAQSAGIRSTLIQTRGCGESVESVYTIEHSSAKMFGILTEPAHLESTDDCLVYLNAGAIRHIGPNRMWAESARRWAAHGVSSLRLDLHGIGESDGEECLNIPALYEECLLQQIEAALESLRRDAGKKRFMVIGLCSGACWAFHAALREPDVRAAILLNPSLLYWDPAVDRRRIVKGMASGIAVWTGYLRLIRSGLDRGEIRRGLRRVVERLRRKRTRPGLHLQLNFAGVAEAWLALERAEKRLALVFRDGEALLNEMEASGELPPDRNPFARCIRVPNGGHTFRPLWAQKLVHEIIDAEIASAITDAAPNPSASTCSSGVKR